MAAHADRGGDCDLAALVYAVCDPTGTSLSRILIDATGLRKAIPHTDPAGRARALTRLLSDAK